MIVSTFVPCGTLMNVFTSGLMTVRTCQIISLLKRHTCILCYNVFQQSKATVEDFIFKRRIASNDSILAKQDSKLILYLDVYVCLDLTLVAQHTKYLYEIKC